MSEKNFNSISNFEVPQSWIDGALNIPTTPHSKKPVVFFVKHSGVIASAACIVLVCVMSLFLFFMTKDGATVRIDSNKTSQTDSNTDKVTNNPTNPDEDYVYPLVVDPSQFATTLDGEVVTPTLPFENPTLAPTDVPSEPDITEKPTSAPVDPPTEEPTDVPTEEPTAVPTEDPTITPTGPVEYPSAPPTDPPTEPVDYENIGIHGRVDTTKLTGSKKVYCKLYDPNGSLMGDSNLFASSHLAINGITDPSITVVHYYPYRHLDISISGRYTYVFYNEAGEELKKSSTYLEANIDK